MPWFVIVAGVIGFAMLTDLDSEQVFFNLVSPIACTLFVLIGLVKMIGGNGPGGSGGSSDGGYWGGDDFGGGDGGDGGGGD
ncbi:hypothetical protein [Litoribrevibacter albus]|uniref:Uncharacterized protein n=1 Tax=Litoribrevibacter albus TaxID=1473156 RepID=A0AA37SC43_9GAMM|nr:hypothetical protein [Litoribrevibacter albus]GLQ31973.1 hypothetical protein GCM10007876_24520 [Litoribrevibacter albus]